MPERRDPETTPGVASTQGDPEHDFTLPAELWADAVTFWRDAESAARHRRLGDGDLEGRYATAAITAAFMALEGVLNQAAFGHADAHRSRLQQITIDILEERETTLDDVGRISRRTRYWPADARRQFVVRFLAGRPMERTHDVWRNLGGERRPRSLRSPEAPLHPTAA